MIDVRLLSYLSCASFGCYVLWLCFNGASDPKNENQFSGCAVSQHDERPKGIL
jgi:hypothetical protein